MCQPPGMRVQALLQTKQGLSPMQSWQNSSDKKTPQEIAIERHARRDAVAVQGLRSVSCRVSTPLCTVLCRVVV